VLQPNITYQDADLDTPHQDADWVTYVVSGTSATELVSLDGDGHQEVSQTTVNSPATVSPLLSLFLLSSVNTTF
jgi:hypothetical protein